MEFSKQQHLQILVMRLNGCTLAFGLNRSSLFFSFDRYLYKIFKPSFYSYFRSQKSEIIQILVYITWALFLCILFGFAEASCKLGGVTSKVTILTSCYGVRRCHQLKFCIEFLFVNIQLQFLQRVEQVAAVKLMKLKLKMNFSQDLRQQLEESIRYCLRILTRMDDLKRK